MHSKSAENYLKVIYALCQQHPTGAATNAIAEKLQTKASSVTDMVKKLAEKDLAIYKPYQGVTLTDQGVKAAINIIRKHRLWEVFLVEKLQFKWDEVHDLAEQLEHIQSTELTRRLDHFLGYPQFDPHGDPIPDADGKMANRETLLVSEMQPQDYGMIVGVNDSSSDFLQYLESQQLTLGVKLRLKQFFDYDQSAVIELQNQKNLTISKQVSNNLCIKLIESL